MKRLRKGLILLLVAIFLAGCGPQSNKASNTITPTMKPILGKVMAANFISSDVGWMSVENQKVGTENSSIVVYRTDNGGKTWTKQLDFNVSGSSPTVGWMKFFDASNGLVLGTGGRYLYRTTDGGYHWLTLNLPTSVISSSMLVFSSPLNGWVIDITGAAAGSETANIYRTVDGGSRWETIATTPTLTTTNAVSGQLPAGGEGGIAFKDASIGWVTGSAHVQGGSYLFKTSDGGLHWQAQVFTLPLGKNPTQKTLRLIFSPPPGWDQAEIATLPPRFTNSQDGALPIYVNTYFYLSFTQDGGQHWGTPVKFPATYDGVTVPIWAFFNANNLMTTADSHLWSTQNGGQSWTDFVIPQNMTVATMGFINSSLGWALASGGTSPNQQVVLMQTTDGGRNWAIVPAITR